MLCANEVGDGVMKKRLLITLVIGVFALAGCSRTDTPSGENSSLSHKESPVQPAFAEAIKCLAECRTLWFYRNGAPSSSYSLQSARAFDVFISEDERWNSFEKMRKLLPPLAMGWFGRPTPPDKWHGGLTQVVKHGESIVYLYTGVSVFRFGAKDEGVLDLAFEPSTGKMAAVVNGGSSRNQRYLVGSADLHPVIIAYAALSDLSFADMDLHYAKNKDGVLYLGFPVEFPAGSRGVEAADRIRVMNDQLGVIGRTDALVSPNESLEAQKIRREKRWFAVGQGRDKCVESPISPVDQIAVIREAGINPIVQEFNDNDALSRVEVSADNRVWIYWKSREACEISLPARTEIPDRYR